MSRACDLVRSSAERDGASPALVQGEAALSYSELWDRVRAAAAWLADAGVRPGDRVAIYTEKRPDAVAAIFGASLAGAAFVPVNPLLRPAQVAHIVGHSGARALLTTSQRRESLGDALEGCDALETTLLAEEQPESGDPGRAPDGGPDGLAAILYTSGSTGLPKGVALSNRNLLAGAASVSGYLGITAADRLLAALPLSFDAGLSQLTTGFTAGARVVLHEYLLPADAVRACAEHRITGLTCVPPLWIQLAGQEWPDEARDAMRFVANTGGRMPRDTLERLRRIFPSAQPFLMYGLTEAFRSTYLDPAQVDARPDSIGKAIPGEQVLVVRQDGTECDPGEEGELVHRGALVALGYWEDPEATAERFHPAPGLSGDAPTVWSGDRAVRDAEGFIYFVGRDDEMIKTSGYRVSPTEIEEAARATGLAGDAAAFGVPDERLGQRIVLVACGDGEEPDADALAGALRRELPTYMLPSRVVPRRELPRSPNGKVDRAMLREGLEAEVEPA